jgi:aryl-phospho-beta-D-glucosidase BglC (GH1 family)
MAGCKKDKPNTLGVKPTEVIFEKSGGTITINITTDTPPWNISSDAAWLQISQTTGTATTASVSLTVPDNSDSDPRSAVITISAGSAPTLQIPVSQKGSLYPNYNLSPIDPDATGMSSTAMDIANKIKIGWNIGNTLEAIGSETAWGNPSITKDLIQLVKQSGFNAIRLPCSWDQYSDQTSAQIKSFWLERVKEVVKYCVDNDMYVILNIHWDGGWLENNCTLAKQEENNAKQKAFWQQIATSLRDFDEHLLFASANEPNVENATEMTVLLSYHQTFIDAVRSTGGKNAYRVLVVQGPNTDIETTIKLMTKMPTDNIPGRLMAEIHYYTPWNFTGMTQDESWGSQFYYWGINYHSTTDLVHNPTWGEEDAVDTYFSQMKKQFVEKGIPVVLGEFGAMHRYNLTGDALSLHLNSRAHYLKYVTKQAKINGLLPFYWDNGGLDNFSSGIFDRYTNTVFDQQSLDSLIQGANK